MKWQYKVLHTDAKGFLGSKVVDEPALELKLNQLGATAVKYRRFPAFLSERTVFGAINGRGEQLKGRMEHILTVG